MPLDEKQKKALKKKYKEHRRAIWQGETSRSKKDEVEREDTFLDNFEQKQPEISTKKEHQSPEQLDNETVQTQRLHSNSNSMNQSQLVEKIKEQRRATWAGESSSRSKLKDKELKRETPEVEQEYQDEPNEEKDGITWKLAIAVIIGITGAIGLGVYLGYIIASYL